MTDRMAIAERVRRACVDAALAAYDDAGMQGLCGEGRWEYAINVLRRLDLAEILTDQAGAGASRDAVGGAGDGA